MNQLIAFSPKHQLDCKENLADFIERAKTQLKIYEDQGGFASSNWKHYLDNGRSQAMEFTGLAPAGKKTGKPMESPYIDFAKAYVRDNQAWKATNPGNMMMVLKACHDSLLQVHSKADILLVDGLVIHKMSEMIFERSSESSRYRYGQMMEQFIHDLRKFKINLKIPSWKNPWKRPGNRAQGTSHEDRAWQAQRLLSTYEITALADTFSLAKTDYQKFYSAQAVLLMCAPSRGGELCFLTTDCLFEDTDIKKVKNEETGQFEDKETSILYIRWKAEKGGGLIPKPIHPLIAPTVREAVNRLIEIGEPARKAAKWAIEYPDQFYRHDGCITSKDHTEDDPLSVAEFAAAMGFSDPSRTLSESAFTHGSAIKRLFFQKWVTELVGEKEYVTYRDLAKYQVRMFSAAFPAWPNIAEIGKPISQMLCLIREHEFHETFSPKKYSFVSPSLNLLNDALGAIHQRLPGAHSLFSELDIKNEDGTELVISSHQIRVWLSTMAERGEMDSLDLAMFAGRSRVQDNPAYDLRPMSELKQESKRLLALGLESLDGTKALAAVKVNVPVTFEMLGRKDRVGTVQVSGYGYCEHDWTMTPCTKAGECISCKEHVCVKGLPKNVEHLKQLEEVVQKELNIAAAATKEGFYGANVWLVYHGKKLAIIKTLLKYLEDNQLPDGLILRIPEELDVSLTKIALGEQNLINTVDEKNPMSERTINETKNSFLALLQGGL
jgi:hypothetical protein